MPVTHSGCCQGHDRAVKWKRIKNGTLASSSKSIEYIYVRGVTYSYCRTEECYRIKKSLFNIAAHCIPPLQTLQQLTKAGVTLCCYLPLGAFISCLLAVTAEACHTVQIHWACSTSHPTEAIATLTVVGRDDKSLSCTRFHFELLLIIA